MQLTGCRKYVLGEVGGVGVQYNTDTGVNLGGGGGVGGWGVQSLFQTDRAIYLASQLSSMQLVSKNNGEGKGKVQRLLVKH